MPLQDIQEEDERKGSRDLLPSDRLHAGVEEIKPVLNGRLGVFLRIGSQLGIEDSVQHCGL